jgi:hypothetical protein
MFIRTYSQTETDLAFQWVDKYFKLVELILEISGDEDNDILPSVPSSEPEQTFRGLRRWFIAHKDQLIPIWSEFWRDNLPKSYFQDNANGQDYFENPFLMLYRPENLHQVAYRLGITEHIDTWEPIELGADLVSDISVEFSLEVLQFSHFIGEFADD